MKLLAAIVSALALLTCAATVQAADANRHVVFCTPSEYVSYPQISTEEFNMTADRFCLSPDEGHGRANVEGFRAALAATRVLVFGPVQDGAQPNLNLIFADAQNAKAVKDFLKSGGTLVIDQTPIDSKGAFAAFLTDVGVAVPKSGGLPALEKGKQHTAVAAKDGKDAKHPLATTPNAFGERELAPRVNSAFASWGPKQSAPVRAFRKPEFGVLVVQEGVNGAGRVVFNTTGMFNGTRNDGAQLCENLYSLAFGAEIRRLPPPRTRYVVKTGWRVWGKNPYAGFPLERDAADKSLLDQIKLSAAVNERLSAEALITNAADAPVADLAFSCSELKSGADTLPPVVLRELVFDHSDGANPDPLPETKGIAVAPGETRILWMTFDTTSAKPGEYKGELTLKPAAGDPRKLPVTLRVMPITLPVENPLRFTTWELFYSWRDKLVENRENWKYFHQDMIDHGVNVFHASFGNPPRIVDAAGKPVFGPDAFKAMQERLYTTDKRSMYLVYGNIEESFHPQDKKKGAELKFPSPEHTRAYTAYVAEISKFFKSQGMTNDQFAFYPYDEIPATKVPNALLTYAAIREADPKANIFVTLGGHSISEFFETKQGRPIKDLAPYVTIWVPGIAFYPYFANPNSETSKRVAKVIDFCKQTGNQVWSYNVTTRSGYDLAPYQRYRLKPWGAFALGLSGYGFYGINHWKQDTYMAVYPGPRPIPSIRWEAVREGLNDVKYMMILKDEIARAKKAGRPTAAAEDLLSRALSEVNAKSLDASLAPMYREKIAAMTLELRK